MSLQAIADAILGPLLGWMLDLPPILTLIIVALFISVASVLIQKFVTNQERLKHLKKETKRYQEEMKKHRQDPKKTMKLQKEMMPLQMEMMKESFKPALWTMLPFLLLFVWLSGHFAYLPLAPGQPFDITIQTELNKVALEVQPELTVEPALVRDANEEGKIVWTLTGDAGYYTLHFSDPTTREGAAPLVTKNILITAEKEYEKPLETYRGPIKKLTVGNKKMRPLGSFTLFGWPPSWIFVYIILSLIFSMSLRKALDVA